MGCFRVAVVDEIGHTMEAKLEFTRHPTLLAPVMPTSRLEISGITPDLIGFELPLIPLMRLEENLAGSAVSARRG